MDIQNQLKPLNRKSRTRGFDLESPSLVFVQVSLCYHFTIHPHTRGCRECGLPRMIVWGWMVVDISAYQIGTSYKHIGTSQPYHMPKIWKGSTATQ